MYNKILVKWWTMRFIWTYFVKEFKRNLTKILLAIIITLILFMSAFTLCNLAAALPKNFYNYYEEFYNDDINITVYDADRELLDKCPEYFDEYKLDSNVESWVSFRCGDKEPFKSWGEIKDNDITYLTFYNGMAVDSNNKFFKESAEKISFREGSVDWNSPLQDAKPFKQRGVWLSDKIADAIGADIDSMVTFNIKNFETATSPDESFDLKVLGIYDYQLTKDNLSARDREHLAYFYMNNVEVDKIYLETHSKYEVTGKLDKIENLFELYSYLSLNYNVAESYIMDMVISVKNAEIICGIIGAIMLLGGLVIMLNFLSMFISSNSKNIGLYCALGTRQSIISLSYLLIFFIMISFACAISWSVLPLYNWIVELYCASIGYKFTIAINYGVIIALFVAAYAMTAVLMAAKHWWMKKTMPIVLLKEED